MCVCNCLLCGRVSPQKLEPFLFVEKQKWSSHVSKYLYQYLSRKHAYPQTKWHCFMPFQAPHRRVNTSPMYRFIRNKAIKALGCKATETPYRDGEKFWPYLYCWDIGTSSVTILEPHFYSYGPTVTVLVGKLTRAKLDRMGVRLGDYNGVSADMILVSPPRPNHDVHTVDFYWGNYGDGFMKVVFIQSRLFMVEPVLKQIAQGLA